MKRIKFTTLATLCAFGLSVVGFSGCSGSGQESLLSGDQQTKVQQRLASRTWIPEREKEATEELQQAMDFLYAYMPYGDVADYPQELFRSNAQAALTARSQMPWGSVVPNDLFVHFVLPVRINNESLDTSREDFYAELKERTEGLSMLDAILETNHWCHEKVVYTPTDGRTFSPSALVKNAAGRCGEESTFTVAALRSIGIPARQIYVPRWAHTDDNHAWVEAWADGKWYYIGACEPEAVANRGWFDAPAKRSLLMFAEVFGEYCGSEDVVAQGETFSEINVTENYAPVKKFSATVVDSSGKVVEGAEVMFKIYNYGELYSAIRTTSDAQGKAYFTAGLGDVLLVAKSSGKYGHAKIDLRRSDSIEITLNMDGSEPYNYTEDLTPPAQLPVEGDVAPELVAANRIRYAQEDSIRGAYVATFLSKEAAAELASKISQPAQRIEPLIANARGNSQEIYDFLVETPAEKMSVAVDLLEVISVKDLKDTPKEVLRDHLDGAFEYRDKPYFKEYILNPRVDRELLTAYRSVLSAITLDGTRPQVGFEDLRKSRVSVTPLGVNNLKIADPLAYSRYMIALYRSCGIAARKEPLTERPQFFDGQKWVAIELPWAEESKNNNVPKGTLKVALEKGSPTEDPKYYSHFTLARLSDGEFSTVDMSHTVAADMGEGISYKSLCANDLELEEGTYQLTTGTRMADGTVLLQGEVFVVEGGEQSTVPMVLRQNSDELQVIGKMDPESMYVSKGETSESSLLSTTGRGYFIVAVIDAQKEPTTHLLRGLEAIKDELEAWGRPIVLIFRNKEEEQRFNADHFPGLPSTVCFGSDSDGKTAKMLTSMLELDSPQWPIVTV
ncbi:MAG: transglutaminase domain-containing protein, partial [Rikenellaceae bacterium]